MEYQAATPKSAIAPADIERLRETVLAIHHRLLPEGKGLSFVYSGATVKAEIFTDGSVVRIEESEERGRGPARLEMIQDEALLKAIGRHAVARVQEAGLFDPAQAEVAIAAEADATPEALYALRKTLKMSLREVEEITGIGFSYISKVEKKLTNTRPGLIREMMDKLAAAAKAKAG